MKKCKVEYYNDQVFNLELPVHGYKSNQQLAKDIFRLYDQLNASAISRIVIGDETFFPPLF